MTLDGAECLVFFLGGMRNTATTPAMFLGFSSNPALPFLQNAASTSRVRPFFPFQLNRLTDTDGDGFSEYLDPLPAQQNPYLYLMGYTPATYKPLYSGSYSNSDPTSRLTSIYTQSATKAWNPNTYQVISPGQDGNYGSGGLYSPNGSSLSEADNDNITNFNTGGTLGN